ncbi:FAD-binding domain-containing protein [Roridomyces roridus]|uniref:FAD-binding domain-containing protein n=1 Tax=Roridomyces roridus TaxID=1738132 RepID=A0AAD7C0I9_9AGAR|nr:FAD-binding domain-containing protein [Roridomyces roridus]
MLVSLAAVILSRLALAAQAQSLSDNSRAACAVIQQALGSTIVQSSGAEYNATAEGTWSLFNALDQPTCIVYPQRAADVQIAMKNIYHFNAEYAVRAGGHSAMIGWNSVTDGVLISFEQMSNVSYDPATDIVSLEPGVRFGDAETVLEQYGVSIIGGRASDIGTGLLLGGGINFMSPLYGWSADRMKEMDVVLVTGELVTASATNEYADLFRALKGGANRFGIVTQYRVYPAHTGTRDDKLWFGGSVQYPGSSSLALLNATAHYIRDVTNPNAGAIMIINTANLTSPTSNTLFFFYKGDSLPWSIFGEFLCIPSTSQSLSPLSYFDITFLIAGNTRVNGNQFGASAWVGDDAAFLNGFNHLLNFTQNFGTRLVEASMIVSPIPLSQWEASLSGPNAIGNPGVSYGAINWDIVYPAGETERPQDIDDGVKLLISQTPPSPGLPLYVNECDASQDVFATYPDYPALKAAYAKYDRTRFNVEYTEGPKGL